MNDLAQYGEFATWLQMVNLTPVAVALCLFLAFVGAVVFGPYFAGRG